MLDDEEFKRAPYFCIRAPKAAFESECLALFCAKYEHITGLHEENPNAIYHHVLSMYGPPCANCGKPLRTPRAKMGRLSDAPQ
jgi:hypothetical protein